MIEDKYDGVEVWENNLYVPTRRKNYDTHLI